MPAIFQSALHPAGPQAASISHLWWLMFWTCSAVYVIVIAALLVAISRRRMDTRPSDGTLRTSVVTAAGITVVILFGLLFASVATGRAVASLGAAEALVIDITGHQWWWDVTYENPTPSLQVKTANELHIPVGRQIRIQLKSSDVIHSFWVPNLHGKMDLIPGRQNLLWLQADKPGVYRGQCAEYCGVQHANMALTVVAESSDDFERWIMAQRQPAPPPSTPEQQHGLQIVERGPCAMCHNVTGTVAGGRTAPDLTHVATRSTIAAGTAPNTRGYLAGWIADPQHMKPGAKMPSTGLSAEELQAVLAYLETLR
ncbi:MAG TPA: cytochrome c oxidase subunit II [Vicinamibacterales bacterium]|jgi:cytochrome c oxidase subunit 2|nr:cytochrome c oxidase subunit II [Vicinamibacterales bacterium]